jgi:hypothetical protein
MKTAGIILILLGIALLLFSGTAVSAVPDIRNTDIETQSAAAGLERAFDAVVARADDPSWIGYAVPLLPGWEICCGNSHWERCICKLERRHESYSFTNHSDDKDLRVSREALILFRIEDGEVERIRTYSDNCQLDAGGVPFYWLTDVDPQESIDLLSKFATEHRTSKRMREKVSERALSAIAVHDHPGMLDALENFVDPDQPEWLREKSVFWIGNSGGHRAIDILRRVVRDDPSSDVREQCVFALTLPDEPEATDLLINLARTDHDSDVRKNAIFWLSQAAGEKAAEAIADAINDDPDTDVKEQAVFALSQLPDDEGIPLLIHVARTNRNPDVREKAIFWLGQSGDDRALDFFEEVLSQ